MVDEVGGGRPTAVDEGRRWKMVVASSTDSDRWGRQWRQVMWPSMTISAVDDGNW